MPKSTKKRKEKTADFTKAKLKLGKGKQVPSNATDTSFKARSIALPSQSIDRDVRRTENEPTTKRRLSLDDLLTRIKHYSPGTRKDAILGLRELLDEHQELIDAHLGPVISATVNIITDEDTGVRRGLIHLYEWLLPLASENNLAPHSPLILLHTTSALSHIFIEIRVDAVKFLDLLMDIVPQVFLPVNQKTIDGYLAMLNLRGKSNEDGLPGPLSTPTSLSVSSRLFVLKSLIKLVRISLASTKHEELILSNTPQTPTWFFRSSLTTRGAYSFIHSTICKPEPSKCPPPTFIQQELHSEISCSALSQVLPLLHTSKGWKVSDLSLNLVSEGTLYSEDRADSAMILELSRVPQTLVTSIFLDFAPMVFIAGSMTENKKTSIEDVVEFLWCAMELTKTIYREMLQDTFPRETRFDAKERLCLCLSRMALYFPFGATYSGARNTKLDQRLQDMDIMYCELTSLITCTDGLDGLSTPGQNTRIIDGANPKRESRTHRDLPPSQVTAVAEWVIKALNGELSSHISPLGQPLTASSYCTLLPTIWSLLNSGDSSRRTYPKGLEGWSSIQSKLHVAVIEHCRRLSTTSQTKRHAIEFVGFIILMQAHPQYRGLFHLPAAEVTAFALSLPRLLWELNTNDLNCTEVVLHLLLRMIQRRILDEPTLQALLSQLVPFFMVNHALKGDLAGPFTRLVPTSNTDLPKLALDVVINLIQCTPPGDHEGLLFAVDQAIEYRLDHERLRQFWVNREF